MNLVSVYDNGCSSTGLLYQLLAEREPHQSISHKAMPTWEQHCAFFWSKPYEHWYIAEVEGRAVGAVYLTKAREIGIGILKAERGKGYGPWAVQKLMELHPGRFVANINPNNGISLGVFGKLGFSLIQYTFEKQPEGGAS